MTHFFSLLLSSSLRYLFTPLFLYLVRMHEIFTAKFLCLFRCSIDVCPQNTIWMYLTFIHIRFKWISALWLRIKPIRFNVLQLNFRCFQVYWSTFCISLIGFCALPQSKKKTQYLYSFVCSPFTCQPWLQFRNYSVWVSKRTSKIKYHNRIIETKTNEIWRRDN